ncbi:RagB/SusD family nutrient uptake outer membrane protein [Dysgonomonas massiliensis]|uniref:RagB/SusD family nutrient uptake outer membrane protein n=1 Tax=Dysgonomonas massiliensis TaxID=2040292 RepID=UPI000C7789C7|nr:RagB/SusD family nutrient uptake outer membrane protein [Dysgonomonas massiliensis]
MKYIYLSILSFVLFLSSCELDRMPETQFHDDNFWKTERDLRSACNKLYDDLGGFSHDFRSDELVAKSANSISAGSRTTPHESTDWENPYTRIFNANKIIDFAPNADVSEKVLNHYLAQAYFFRAYDYFTLVKRYGDVPLILKSFLDPDDPAIYTARTPREEVIQQCYADLEFAIEWLNTSKNDWGHVTKSAALGLMTRIGLYEGTYGKYHNLNNNYKVHLEKSIEAAEALMKRGHELYPNFSDLFTFKGQGPENKENIFVKVYGPDDAGTEVHKNSREMENKVSLTRQMVDLFLYEDGLPREKSKDAILQDKSFDDVFVKRDPRLAMTIFKRGEEAYKGKYNPLAQNHGFGYGLKKGFMMEEWSTNQKETVDKMLIRYAEILLSYAEALYELNGLISNDKLDATINLVRARAGFNAKLSNEFVKDNDLNMLEEIRRERTVELLDEGFRYDDIIRWKIAEEVLPKAIVGAKYVEGETTKGRDELAKRLTDKNGMVNGEFEYGVEDMYIIELANTRRFNPEKDYLYPIPMKEIIRSKNIITQNPNWN